MLTQSSQLAHNAPQIDWSALHRTLSYEECDFALLENDSDIKSKGAYNASAELWSDLFVALGEYCV
jgi:hypothetical protein